MKIITIALVGGLLVGAVAIPGGDRSDDTVVGSFGEVEPPILPPRIRIVNDAFEDVDIWYSARGAKALRRLGSIPASATTTFEIPADVTLMHVLVVSNATPERYATDRIVIGDGTDIVLEVAPRLAQSTFEVVDLRVALSQ